jgi:LPS sulfotransferase NodH
LRRLGYGAPPGQYTRYAPEMNPTSREGGGGPGKPPLRTRRKEAPVQGMIEGIDTGYEGRFDFPAAAEGPRITFLLASVPRAGSTLFSHNLWRTGCLGAPLEYLNFDPAGPYFFAAASADAQRDLWRSVLRRRTSPNGVFALKAFPTQLQALHGRNPALLADVLATMLPRGGPRRIVYLRRRDRVAQTVSLARAAMTGVWRKEQEGREAGPPEYSLEALEAAERGIAFQEELWEKMLRDLAVEPLRMWHEDVLADRAAAAERVAAYVGVEIDPAAAVDIPQIVKQSRGDADDWAARYRVARVSPTA